MEKLHELEGYEDVMEILASMHTLDELLKFWKPEEVLKYLKREEVLKHLKPEERLAGLKPEERLAGLGPEEILQFLHHLGERGELEGKLPAEVLEALRKATNGTP